MKIIRYQFLFLITIVSLFGCKKDFGDLNISPNSAAIPPTSALLTNVESTLGNVPQNSELGYFVQYYTELQYPGSDLYQTTSVSWDGFYAGPLADLQKIIELCQNNPSAAVLLSGTPTNQIQIARILKAYLFSVLTDRYGDIPYFDALKGNGQVKYDKQQLIYNDLFKELKEANAAFQTNGTAILGDIIYNGDIAKWKKFANSLRLILAMRLSKVDPAKGKSEFADALSSADKYISSNTDNFAITFTTSFVNSYSTLSTASFYALANTVADTLTNHADPRSRIYGQANSTGQIVGVPYGLNRGHNLDWTNSHSFYSLAFDASFKTQTSPVVIIPAAYIDLIRAEADSTYSSGDSSLVLFKKGIQDSWEQWGVTGNIDLYIASFGITTAVDRKNIQLQTWLSLFGTTQNAWNEWRRTGVPALIPSPDAVNQSKQIPRRYAYPLTEANLNQAAYNDAINSFPYGGTDKHDNHVWWDKP